MGFRIHSDRAAGAEIVRVVREQIAVVIAVAGAAKGTAPERARRARVGCKKIRAILRLARPHCPRRCDREDKFLRAAARKLAAVRETNVTVDTLDALRQQWGDKADRGSFTAVRRVLVAARQTTALTEAETGNRLRQFQKKMTKADGRLADWEIEGEGFDVLAAGFEASYAKARHAFRTARTESTIAAYHTWRKRAKTHGYHCKLLRDAWPDIMKKWSRSLKVLTRLLGDEHDLALLREHILTQFDGATGNEGVRSVVALIESRREDLRSEAVTLGRRLFAEKPSAMVRRVSIWWSTAYDHPETDPPELNRPDAEE